MFSALVLKSSFSLQKRLRKNLLRYRKSNTKHALNITLLASNSAPLRQPPWQSTTLEICISSSHRRDVGTRAGGNPPPFMLLQVYKQNLLLQKALHYYSPPPRFSGNPTDLHRTSLLHWWCSACVWILNQREQEYSHLSITRAGWRQAKKQILTLGLTYIKKMFIDQSGFFQKKLSQQAHSLDK